VNALVPVAPAALPADPRHRPVGASRWGMIVFATMGAVGCLMVSLIMGAPAVLTIGAMVALEGVMIARLVRRRRRSFDLIKQSDDAVALLQQGRVDEAAARFDHLLPEAEDTPSLHALVLYNRGVTALAQGNVDQGLSIIDATLRSPWFGHWSKLYGAQGNLSLGLAHLYAGRIDEASRLAAEAHARFTEAKRPMMLPLDAMILARTGRFAEALHLLDSQWMAAEGVMPASSMRPLRILKAFVLQQADGGRTRGAEIQRLVQDGQPNRPTELRAMAQTWPELQHFLAFHQLPW
jgi:hypothetical protein